MKLFNHVHIKDSGDEIMVFDSNTGELYSAASVSREIFMLLRNEVSAEAIVSHICSVFPSETKNSIESDVAVFIDNLKKLKLINDKKN